MLGSDCDAACPHSVARSLDRCFGPVDSALQHQAEQSTVSDPAYPTGHQRCPVASEVLAGYDCWSVMVRAALQRDGPSTAALGRDWAVAVGVETEAEGSVAVAVPAGLVDVEGGS